MSRESPPHVVIEDEGMSRDSYVRLSCKIKPRTTTLIFQDTNMSSTSASTPSQGSYSSNTVAKSAGIFGKIKEYVEEATSAVTQDKDEKIPNNFVSLDTLLANNKRWARNKVATDPEYFARLKDQQSPKILWIGCADSRVPANQILGLAPGEVFVHRNIANVVTHTDLNCHSVLQYAVDVLQVKHVMVVGHYGCGGVKAAMSNNSFGLLDWWLHNIKDVFEEHRVAIEACSSDKDKQDLLVELNAVQSVVNVAKSATLQAAWARGQKVSVHGWAYRLSDGIVRDLGVTVNNPEQLDKVYNVQVTSTAPHH